MIAPLILFAVLSPSSGAPLISTPGPLWRREPSDDDGTPDLRTTQGIVWSCIATIFACTWAAMHPNLSNPYISRWSRFKRRTGTMVIAVLAPEFILIWALRQRIGAETIMEEYNRTIPDIDRDEGQQSVVHRVREWLCVPHSPYNGSAWTLAHGFYVQMGGFLLYNEETPVRVLHFRELLELVESGLVDRPSVTEEDICDRSKGDFLAKSLVVVQTTWFIVQCIARWATGLPVTELEVMTLAFAILTIITYRLWWEKPQNVGVGVRVQLKEERSIRQDTNTNEATSSQDTDVNGRESGGDASTIYTIYSHCSTEETRRQNTNTLFRAEEMDITDPVRMRYSQDADTRTAWPSKNERDITDSTGVISAFEDDFNPVATQFSLEEAVITDGLPRSHPDPQPNWGTSEILHSRPRESIWTRAAAHIGKLLRRPYMLLWGTMLLRKLGAVVVGPLEPAEEIPTGPRNILEPRTLEIGTFYAHDARGRTYGLVAFAVASGVLFGGLHLIPWNFTFPTRTESFIWRISALYITFNPVLLSLPLLIISLVHEGHVYDWLTHGPTLFNLLRPFGRVASLRAIAVTLPLYILARVLVITLAFATLRSQPPEAYKEIPWSSFVPHI